MIEDILESYTHEEILELSNYESHDKGLIVLCKQSINLVLNSILRHEDKELVALMIPNEYTDLMMDSLPTEILYKTVFTKVMDSEISRLRIITMKNNEFISFKYQIN